MPGSRSYTTLSSPPPISHQNRRQRWRKEASSAPGSPTCNSDECDAVHPDSLDRLMRQFIDTPGGGCATGKDHDEDEDDEEGETDEQEGSDGSGRNSHFDGSGDEGDPDAERMWQSVRRGPRGSSRSTARQPSFSPAEAEEREAAYLASLVDIGLEADSLGSSADGGVTGGSGELGVFQQLTRSLVNEAAQRAWIGTDWLLPATDKQPPALSAPPAPLGLYDSSSVYDYPFVTQVSFTLTTTEESDLAPHAFDLGNYALDSSTGNLASEAQCDFVHRQSVLELESYLENYVLAV